MLVRFRLVIGDHCGMHFFPLLALPIYPTSTAVSMSESNSSLHSPLLSHSSLTSLGESSPLLPALSNDGIRSYGTNDASIETTNSKQVSTSTLLWIMSSAWIGTLLSGLGKQCLNLLVALTLDQETISNTGLTRWHDYGHPGSTDRHKFQLPTSSCLARNSFSDRTSSNTTFEWQINGYLLPIVWLDCEQLPLRPRKSHMWIRSRRMDHVIRKIVGRSGWGLSK